MVTPAVLLSMIVALNWSLLVLVVAPLTTIIDPDVVAIVVGSLLLELGISVVKMVKGAVNVVCFTSLIGDSLLDAREVIMFSVAVLTFGAVTLLVDIKPSKMSVVRVLSGAVLVLAVPSLMFTVSDVVVDSNIILLFVDSGTILELGTIAFVLEVLPIGAVAEYILDIKMLVFNIAELVDVTFVFSIFKEAPVSFLLGLKGAELNIILELSAVVEILLDGVAIEISAVVLTLVGSKLVKTTSAFSMLVISSGMFVLTPCSAMFVPLLIVKVIGVLSKVLLTYTAGASEDAVLSSVVKLPDDISFVLDTILCVLIIVLNGFVIVKLAGSKLVLG